MVGSVAANFHEGSRSEILADYLLSGWGVVTPVRGQDDHGIDLYGGLTKRQGQRAVVTDYYVVQVKSTTDPWIFKDAEEVRWLLDYPLPIFLACVNKTKHTVSLYHVTARFNAFTAGPPPTRLELLPSEVSNGECTTWEDGERFDLSAPIVRASMTDLMSRESMAKLRDVFAQWVRIDRDNIDLKRAGFLRLRMPHAYCTNCIPAGAWTEVGNQHPDDSSVQRGMLTLAEALDCLGDQLRARGDRKAALLSALLLDHLQQKYPDHLQSHPRLGQRSRSFLTSTECVELNKLMGEPAPYLFSGIDAVAQALEANPLVRRFLSYGPQAQVTAAIADARQRD
jgi:hypothetical protein